MTMNKHYLTNYLDSVAALIKTARVEDDEKLTILTKFMEKLGFEEDRRESIASYSNDEMNAGMEMKLAGDDLVLEFRYGPEVDYRSIPVALTQVAKGLEPVFEKLEKDYEENNR